MAINLDYLSRIYFAFDEPVPYKLKDGREIKISPVPLKSSEIFLSSVDIISIDKNSYPDVKIIQMSYLQFVYEVLLTDENFGEVNMMKFANILAMCLNLKAPRFIANDGNQLCIKDDVLDILISPKDFDEIREIIMYQNILHYDGSYVNPALKQAMDDVDKLKNRDIDSPSLERKMAIITSHCGLPKKEQESMSYRSHSLLFEEVCGEVEFTTIRPVALIAGGSKDLDHWIFKKKKDKFDGYITSVESYTKSIGGTKAIKSLDTSLGDSYSQQFNNFNQK